mmetsp:Transcript_3361/g.5621  ORF Transcript_3361/g.5621 Transcript_3361/m.5621 type:complete len:188 (+) Transcript_3361:209-772(+)
MPQAQKAQVSMFNEDDILDQLSGGGGGSQGEKKGPQLSNNTYDKIFEATGGSKPGSSSGHRPKTTLRTQQYTQSSSWNKGTAVVEQRNDSRLSQSSIDSNLRGRNLGAEAISSERKKSFFQSYVFDSYKYQIYFNVNTNEIKQKVIDALWPFHPDTQPSGISEDYEVFLEKLAKSGVSRASNGQGGT